MRQRTMRVMMMSYPENTRPQPPCKVACPVHTDARKYIELIAAGKYAEAFEVIRENNPFPSTCSTICAHPCEDDCRRGSVDEPLAIRDLKRFACEQALESRKALRKSFPKTKEKKIAIIGGGPAGMSAAFDLAKTGYPVTIFESASKLGGVLANAIPDYRLPKDLLKHDLEDILAAGIDVRLNTAIGRAQFDELKKMGYSAILISTGLPKSRSLPIPGVDAKGVLLALPFLSEATSGKKISIGKNVIVVGGGNVAVDAARTAVRLGANSVTMVCLESKDEMPAWAWEIEEAKEEGIDIICSQGPHRILEKEGAAVGLEVKLCECVFDEKGRFNPKFCEEKRMTIDGDMIVIAIGQAPDLGFIGDPLLVNERGNLIVNRDSLMTPQPGIFGCGEVASGPGIAIDAVANGKRAARAIDAYLSGTPLAKVTLDVGPKIDSLPNELQEIIPRAKRQKMPILSAGERKTNFKPFELELSEESALAEARRCLNCGAGAECIADKCAACLTCVRVCPFGVPLVTQTADMPADKCLGCGICATECPAGAILMKGYDVNAMKQTLAHEAGKQKKSYVVLFTCTHVSATYAADALPQNVVHVPVACTGRISTIDMLKAFEYGAAGVGVVSCAVETTCRYREGHARVKQRVERVKDLLKEINVTAPLEYFEASAPSEKTWLPLAISLLERVSK